MKKEGEPLSGVFEDYNERSGIETDHESINGSLLDHDSSSSHGDYSTEATFASAVFITIPDVCKEANPLLEPTPAITATIPKEPFPFSKLPLSMRNKIYEHLLVFPAITCVRQKHTSFHDERKAFLYAEHRELSPGIAYALPQVKVDGSKTRSSRFAGIEINILRASKEVFTEARAIMYSKNNFDIVKPTDDMAPQPDFSVPLFQSGYQHFPTRLAFEFEPSTICAGCSTVATTS